MIPSNTAIPLSSRTSQHHRIVSGRSGRAHRRPVLCDSNTGGRSVTVQTRWEGVRSSRLGIDHRLPGGITPILAFPRQGGRDKKGRRALLPDPVSLNSYPVTRRVEVAPPIRQAADSLRARRHFPARPRLPGPPPRPGRTRPAPDRRCPARPTGAGAAGRRAVPCSMNESGNPDAVDGYVPHPGMRQRLQHRGAEPAREHVLLHRHDAPGAASRLQQQIDVQRLHEDRVNDAAVDAVPGERLRRLDGRRGRPCPARKTTTSRPSRIFSPLPIGSSSRSGSSGTPTAAPLAMRMANGPSCLYAV